MLTLCCTQEVRDRLKLPADLPPPGTGGHRVMVGTILGAVAFASLGVLAAAPASVTPA